MATNKANSKPNEAEKVVKNESKIPIEVLRNKCTKLWGISVSTFDGAFFNVKETEFTKSEAKAVIDGWLKKEVKGE